MAKGGKAKSSYLVKLQEARIEVERRGRGRPLLLLQGEETHEAEMPFVDELARRFELFIPWPPGFGRSTRPASIETVDDIAYLYLDLLDRFDLEKVTLLGFSLGGWIAAEMATKCCARLARMVLVAPYGIKTGGPLAREIADIYTLPAETVERLKYHDPAKDPRAGRRLSRREALAIARHRETTARFCWQPYMHNPKLRHRLNRVQVPTLLIWGARDGIVAPDYGRRFRKLIPGATMKVIPKAGHLPHIEQPEAFMRAVCGFLGREQRRAGRRNDGEGARK